MATKLIQNLNIVDPTDSAALLGITFDWPGLPAGGIGDPPVPSFPLPPAPPSGYVWDPSTPGFGPGHIVTVPGVGSFPVPSDWGPDVNSRIPGRLIPIGGSGVAVYKTKKTKKIPNIVWANPAAVPLGTHLSAVQLNAVAHDPITTNVVPGSYAYTPPSGTPTTSLSQPLLVLFTPSDLNTYTLATKQVVIGATGIQFVQARGQFIAWNSGPPNQTSVAFTSNVRAGNLLLLLINPADDSTAIATTDDQGNAWNFVAEAYNPLGVPVAGNGTLLFWTLASISGPCTVTATHTLSGPSLLYGASMAVLEYSGVDTLAPFDSSNTSSSPNSGALTTGNVSISQNNSLLLGGMVSIAGGQTPSGGFNQRLSPIQGIAVWDQIGVAINFGGVPVTGTVSPSARWWAVGASFKPQ